MKTKLDQLLASIHPARTHDVVHRLADEALVTFRIRANILVDALVYRDTVCRFVQHLLHRLGIVPHEIKLWEEDLWRRAIAPLRKTYGPHGEVAAFDIVRTGTEGGLYAVLRHVAVGIANQEVDKEVGLRVDGFCHRLTAEEYLATGLEYLEKHGRFLPPEMLEGSAGRARLNLAELLKRHHHVLRSLVKVVRT